jgi:cell fate regulator YaaT (PSP1 superfamily)
MSDGGGQSTVADSSGGKNTSLEYVVRCGSMRTLGVMAARETYRYGDEVVVRSDRGTEIGTVLCEATATALDSMEEPTQGRILRRLSDTDRSQWEVFNSKSAEDLETCRRCVETLSLVMQLVDVERLLGGERMIVYFIAEKRVDFRQLVRDLAAEFQTRIEMRQIGVRDEAKLLADYGDCGQPICCANFLSKMPPVSMKMAKLQKATLDPTKISGRCGRLKCCLRYEFDTYEALSAELPTVGSEILTRDGNATVLAQDILASQLVIRTEDNRRVLIAASDVIRVLRAAEIDDDEATPKRKRNKRQPRIDDELQ